MNFLDIVLIAFVAIFFFRGIFRGLVQEVLSLGAIVLAIYLASNYQHLIIPHLEIYIKSQITVGALAYVVIFLGTIIFFWLLAKIIRSFLDIALLGWVDRLFGGLFGIVEGSLIALIVLMLLTSFAPDSKTLKESTIAPRSQHLLELVGDITPNSLKDIFNSHNMSLPSVKEAYESATDAIGLKDFEDETP